MGLFPHVSMATITTFPGTSLIVEKTNWVELARKITFGTMPSPNIPGVTFPLNKTFPFPNRLIGALEPMLFGAIIHVLLLS